MARVPNSVMPKGVEQEMPPLTLVIFGASGDLTARKLVPSLYRLDRKNRLPEELRIVGVARSPYTDATFRDKMAADLKEHAASDWDESAWPHFARRLHYVPADAARPGGLRPLRTWLESQGGSRLGRRLFYLAVAPNLYQGIVNQLSAVGLDQTSSEEWVRVVIEKPFGRDLQSSHRLNEELRQCFREEQIYRIDHYLGKETVQNILVFRFANTLFEPLWNSRFIDHVQITVSETVTTDDRAEYYDKTGVLRDMFQNHLLQILTLVALEAPSRFAADPLRNEKVKVLESIAIPTPEEACRQIVTGQYAGYRVHEGVAPRSRTPTYAAIELQIDNWRWRGVPFFLRSGKGLATRSSEVVIQFHCPPHLMFPMPAGSTLDCNRLSMCIQPDEGIHLSFQSKVPDTETVQLQPADMEFHFRDYYDGMLPESYERLLMDALNGDASLFMRSDEIERAWEIMDPLIAAVEQEGAVPPQEYPVGSEGPKCADEFLARTGRKWLSLCRH